MSDVRFFISQASRRLVASAAAFLLGAGGAGAQPCQPAGSGSLLASFGTTTTDGANPYSGVTFGAGGALFGTTFIGGNLNKGTVYKLSPPAPGSAQWSKTLIYSFCAQANCADGASPFGALIFDTTGALYGATTAGGAAGNGAVFKLTPPVAPATAWTQTVLYSFAGAPDGATPYAGPIFGPDGALYGSTIAGGSGGGYGAAFKLTPPGASCMPTSPNLWCETILSSFQGVPDGAEPSGELAIDNNGALYGVTVSGGSAYLGSAFMITPPVAPATNWTRTTLQSFTGDVQNPTSVILSGGALYGVAGAETSAVFKLSPPVAPATQWTLSTLVSGYAPAGRLIIDPSGALSPLVSRYAPAGRLIIDPSGALYGTSPVGYGLIFKLTPPVAPATGWTTTPLFAFSGANGSQPVSGVTFDNNGALYGSTYSGGSANEAGGAVFRVEMVGSCG